MKRSIFLSAALILGVVLAGCKRYDYTEPTNNLRVIRSDVTFEASGGTGTIEVVSGGEPVTAASNKPEWCAVSVSGTTVTVTVPFHAGISNRTAIVTISSGGEHEQVPVTQASMFFSVGEDALDVPAEGAVYQVSYASTLAVTLSQTYDWIIANLGEHEITIEVLKNPLGVERVDTLVVKSGELTHYIAVKQAASTLTYALLPTLEWTLSYTDPATGGEYEIPLVFTRFVKDSYYYVSGWPGHIYPGQSIKYLVGYTPATFDLTIAVNQKAFTDTVRVVDWKLIGWDNVTGKYTWDKTVKLAGTWNLNVDNPEYTFEDNGVWSDGNQVRAIVLGDFVGDNFQGGTSTAMSNLTLKGSVP